MRRLDDQFLQLQDDVRVELNGDELTATVVEIHRDGTSTIDVRSGRYMGMKMRIAIDALRVVDHRKIKAILDKHANA
jgi:hypothetical protein